MEKVVLQKILAKRAEVSRREATRMIEGGRVKVNDKPAELGMRVAESDRIFVDGNELAEPHAVVLAYYKPRGVTSTLKDPHATKTLAQVLPPGAPRVMPAGRLDKDSEGLMILTNNGDLIQKLTHPKFKHEKEYEVTTKRFQTPGTCKKILEGVELDEGVAKADACELKDAKTLNIILHQGWKRQIRRMLEGIGQEVVTLKRTRIGNLHLGKLRPGEVKEIRQSDIV